MPLAFSLHYTVTYGLNAKLSESYCNSKIIDIMTKGKKVKVWVLVIALLMRLEQQRFTISEVAAD